ncbi:MAG: sulfite exporter TauE/SafE family protein [Acidobacteria bacterium]|nr:sulfite exporter TauE/SafE family protein [Acidobacteriota bacterium]
MIDFPIRVPDFPLYKWLLGALVAFSVGVAKTGVPGFGIMAVPVFVLTVGDARLSAGWLLPLLIAADVFAVFYFRRHAAAGALFSLFPWVMAGMIGGAIVLGYPDGLIRPLVGTITLAMLLLHLWRQRRVAESPPAGWRHASFYGTAAGFATMVANAAGPIMNLYLLSKRLPREEFVATGAWFFFIVNLTKVPVYSRLQLFSSQSLLFDLALLPFVIGGALTGRKLLTVMPEKAFIHCVFGFAFLATLLLFLPK